MNFQSLESANAMLLQLTNALSYNKVGSEKHKVLQDELDLVYIWLNGFYTEASNSTLIDLGLTEQGHDCWINGYNTSMNTKNEVIEVPETILSY